MTPAIAPTPPAGAALSSNSDPDYATVEFSDPVGLLEPADFPEQAAQNLSAYNVANGVLDAQVNAGGGLILAETRSRARSRSAAARHCTRSTPTTCARSRSGCGPTSTRSGGFFWYTCDHIIPSCENGFPFTGPGGLARLRRSTSRAQAHASAGAPGLGRHDQGHPSRARRAAPTSTSSSTTSASSRLAASSAPPVTGRPAARRRQPVRGRRHRLREPRSRRRVGHEPAERHRRARRT